LKKLYNGSSIRLNSTSSPGENIEFVAIDLLRPNVANPRTHSPRQLKRLAKSIKRFGFINPIIADEHNHIIAGHGRVAAARQLGLTEVPVRRVGHFSETDKRLYAIADNRLGDLAGWNREALKIEIQDLEIEDIEGTGFSSAEIEVFLNGGKQASSNSGRADDEIPWLEDTPITRPDELWLLDQHRMFCGHADQQGGYERLLGGELVDLVFINRPEPEFRGIGPPEFFETLFRNVVTVSENGALHFVCLLWQQVSDVLSAGHGIYNKHLWDLCVLVKDEPGPGGLYPSRHEIVLAFKVGTAPPVSNHAGLELYGHDRTNVWTYPNLRFRGSERPDALLMGGINIKPVALVADAISDCSNPNGIILDPLATCGTTLIAAEKTGRRARCMEADPRFVDCAIRRWENFTGRSAVLAGTTTTFAEREQSVKAAAKEFDR
jgi:hypothetical protein